jgi:hypothetical protein
VQIPSVLPFPFQAPPPLAPPSQNGTTPLHFAARRGLLQIIDKLLAMDVDIDIKDDWVPQSPPLPHGAAYACGTAHNMFVAICHRPITLPSNAHTRSVGAPAPMRMLPRAATSACLFSNRQLPLLRSQ